MKKNCTYGLLILVSLLFSKTALADDCPIIPNFSLTAVNQDFHHCTYTSSTVNGSEQNDQLCLQAFSLAFTPSDKKESCHYQKKNQACVCTIGK